MVRAPCCERMGLKKGPWTPEEDLILINFINLHGHPNWRSLPKQAGLLRCGKSCRLRWTNYLRPDIKRGNFTREEEDAIIELHEKLGNRWSAIAARLPGRTDNEIKNVWHTHLKKRLNQNKTTPVTKQPQSTTNIQIYDQITQKESEPMNYYPNQVRLQSPQHSSSDISSVTTTTWMKGDELDNFFEVDDNFWSEVFSADNSGTMNDFLATTADPQVQFQFSPIDGAEHAHGYNSSVDYYWYNLLTTAGELPNLTEF
ncbi:unnamed protein product [Camellia sinensis]